MTEPSAHLLVVDDDDRIRDLLKRYLTKAGYRVTAAAHAAGGKSVLSSVDFDLAIFDIMMPGESGLSLLEMMRRENNDTPVILLTARGDPDDRINGLKLGADDYLAKPFEPEELALRVQAILRRQAPAEPVDEFSMSGLVFNIARGELKSGDRRVRLTEAELQLLTALARHAGEPVSREQLAALTSSGMERSIDVQVTRLRRKIEPEPREPIHIQTVRGVGYRLMPD
ncbi:MAG: response regulator [Pseudomonadota bacterium]